MKVEIEKKNVEMILKELHGQCMQALSGCSETDRRMLVKRLFDALDTSVPGNANSIQPGDSFSEIAD